ncbi:MAG: flagellar basal body L-ring protein [Rhodospirillales bacterium RIFCSPLOWO2_01_FULL_65_14]|nr:MAG: flagellar basal body L-ring protein [Rhodospirillales bacterium RIFCSPLOWO2_01_FULL_65_14]
MKRKIARNVARLTALSLMATSLAGCNLLTRMSEVGGEGPKLTNIVNPMARPDYRPVSLPMPAPQVVEDNPNSLWRSGAKAFFKDHRAKDIGDIVTVKLALADSAKLENKTERDRDDSETTGVPHLLGLEAELTKVLPQGADATQLMAFANRHSTSGDGEIDRSETISLTFAAVVTQILPNGSLVIVGRQEIRVNAELRELLVTGVIRPSDIDSDNTISHEKIAEMRVAYGGRGTLSQIQQPRWGTQIWDIIFPF